MFGLFLTGLMGTPTYLAPTMLAQIINVSSYQIYQPTNRKTRRQARKSGGSRGSCPQKTKSGITLLVPEDHIPLTSSAYPTFAWYQEQKSSLPVKFTLLEPGHKPIYSQELTITRSGLIILSLPKTVSALEMGKKYRWSVSIICNPQHPSQNPYAEAWIERTSVPWIKTEKLQENSCGLTYAQLGIWYDAIACELKRVNSEIANLNYLDILLQEVDLQYILEKQPSLSQK